MSTQKTSTTTNQFDSQSMNRYQGAQNSLASKATQMFQNPFSGPQYAMGLQQQNNASNILSANANRNAMSNMNMSGLGGLTGGARASLLSGLSRSASNTRMQGFMNNFNTANQNMWNSASLLSSIQPLQTGATNVEKTSGTGTWLPQLIGAGVSAGMGVATGGMSSLSKGISNTVGGLTSPFGGGFGSGNMPSQLNGMSSPGAPSSQFSSLPMGPGYARF